MKILLQDFSRSFSCLGSRGTARIHGLPMDTSAAKYHDPHFLPHIAKKVLQGKAALTPGTDQKYDSFCSLSPSWMVDN